MNYYNELTRFDAAISMSCEFQDDSFGNAVEAPNETDVIVACFINEDLH